MSLGPPSIEIDFRVHEAKGAWVERCQAAFGSWTTKRELELSTILNEMDYDVKPRACSTWDPSKRYLSMKVNAHM